MTLRVNLRRNNKSTINIVPGRQSYFPIEIFITTTLLKPSGKRGSYYIESIRVAINILEETSIGLIEIDIARGRSSRRFTF